MCLSILPLGLVAQSPFVDRANELGLIHSYDGDNAGGGVSCIDFNLDGLDDITLATAEGQIIKFFINKGYDGFEEVNLIPDNLFKVKQILWIDYDNDGDKDLFAAAFDGVNKLYRNNGALQLEDVSEEAGLPQDSTRTMGASFGDYNRDGWLDLYFTQRTRIGQNTPNQNRLFKNNADGTFQDVSLETNSSDLNRLPFCSVFADFNNDKWPDIYIANDRSKRNTLLINYSGFFIDASIESGCGLEMEAMCTAIGDYNRDGLLDAYVSNNVAGNKFFVNNPDSINNPYPVFFEKAEELNITVNSNCWGSILFDHDNDSDLDLYVSSSLVGSDTAQSVLFIQNSESAFHRNQYPLIGDTVSSFNNAIGDFNSDGFSDMIVINKSPFNLNCWVNENQNNNYIKVKLRGVLSNRDAIGVRLELYSGEDYQQLYTTSAIGFFGQNSDTYIFGLDDKIVADSLKITWPTGHVDLIVDLDANKLYNIYEGQSNEDSIQVDEDIMITSNNFETDSLINSVKKKNTYIIKQLICSPNPASTQLHLETPEDISNYEVLVFDVNGTHFKLKAETNYLNIEHLKTGVYFVKIQLDNIVHQGRFIKID